MPARELVDAADRLFKKVLHHRYSALTRMVPAVNLPLRIEAIARTLARTVDRVTGVDEDDGFYCSELVRMFFAELGLDLFHGETGPACISPNALDSPSCLLDEVRDAFVVIDNIGSDIQGFESQCHIPGREQRLPPLVESQDRARHSANRMRTLFEKMRAMSERIDHLSETQGRTLYAQVAQSTERAFASGDDEVAARFGDYLVALHYINHVERQIHDYHRRMTASEAIPVESDAWSPAYVALTQTFVLSRLDLHLKYFRSHVTYTLQQIRRQCRLAGECWRGKRLERVRREFLEEWREARTGLRRVARSVAETKGIEALSPESMSYVDEVLEAAAVTAMQDCPMVWSGFGRRDPLRG
ncbi:MAG TPA: hypothetical protein VI485_07785 [Vicinamibacterales bacterium]|nr:hypothetical protein [Vicinamibacterales bacterium]